MALNFAIPAAWLMFFLILIMSLLLSGFWESRVIELFV